MTQTFSKGSTYKRPATWEQPDVLRQFQEHVLETTKNAFSLEDTKKRVAHNSSYVSFIRKGRTAKEQADVTRNETDDNVNLGMHPYRCDHHCVLLLSHAFNKSCAITRCVAT